MEGCPCGVRSKLNKFENVLDAGGGVFLHSEVQCIMGNGHMGPLLCEQTGLKTSPSISFSGGR